TANRVGDQQGLSVKTNYFNADITGKYSVAALFPEIINFVNLYYVVADPVPALRGDQQARIRVSINPSPQLFQIFPDLQFAKPIHFSLDINTEKCLFDLKGTIPSLVYGTQYIAGANITAQTNDSAMAYKIFIDEYASSLYEIPTLLVQGDIIQHVVYTDIRLLDNSGHLQHTLEGRIEQRDSGYAIHIDPNSVLLDYDKWGLDPANELYIAANGIYANSFTFSNGTQALVLQTWGEDVNDPIGIRLFNFKISTFTSLARQDSLYLDGTINGVAEIKLKTAHPIFTADLSLDDLTFKKDTLGNITLKVSNEVQDVFKVNAALGGYGNDLSIYGDYDLSKDAFDIQFDIEHLTMQTLQPFTMGYLNQMKGHLEGGVSLTGTINKPVVVGNLLFRDAEAKVPLLNSVFSLRNERIRFLPDGMHFNEFTLTDENGKQAILNGTLLTQNWLDYRYNLDFTANDFRVINSTRRDNKLFYGTLFLDTRIRFRGTSARPEITANFRANNRTDLTMVLPQDDPEVAEREGVVEFFDPGNPDTDSLRASKIDSLNTSGIRGISLSANLEIDPNVKLSFVIDERNGDMLVAKGVANLSGSIDPSGKISLSGKYELNEGSYEMTLRVMKFRFLIEKGSTITWTGEPTTADINIT
ncbi:MAG TPA: translocation/assembly module TamB domain-containing protein, partial [Phnomibacter sp.]|nr:translocation/assembly module TamB domain-containing protein [Phnomibacter sp.]